MVDNETSQQDSDASKETPVDPENLDPREQMREALLVNPYDTEATAAAIQLALQMPLDERRARHEALLEGCKRQDVHWWCDTFLDHLSKAKAEETGTALLLRCLTAMREYGYGYAIIGSVGPVEFIEIRFNSFKLISGYHTTV